MLDRAIGLLVIALGVAVVGGGGWLARRYRKAATYSGIGRGGHGPFAGFLGVLGLMLVVMGLCMALVGVMIGFA